MTDWRLVDRRTSCRPGNLDSSVVRRRMPGSSRRAGGPRVRTSSRETNSRRRWVRARKYGLRPPTTITKNNQQAHVTDADLECENGELATDSTHTCKGERAVQQQQQNGQQKCGASLPQSKPRQPTVSWPPRAVKPANVDEPLVRSLVLSLARGAAMEQVLWRRADPSALSARLNYLGPFFFLRRASFDGPTSTMEKRSAVMTTKKRKPEEDQNVAAAAAEQQSE